ncbi:YnfE family protein, partial [Bacillus licheniformis]|uniref:YnfE family protein n=1 Tax=Bacillus licheniformis TaxID=1402 RepID=UPI0030C85BE4
MVSVFVYIIMEGMRNIFVNMKGDGCMNETLQQYMMLVKEHYDTINGPDYTG